MASLMEVATGGSAPAMELLLDAGGVAGELLYLVQGENEG